MISQAAADDKHWATWKPEVFGDIFQRKTYRPLPPKHEAMALLKDFFENFNTMFPLFHEPTFMHLVDRHYSLEPYEGSGWWASLNVALAITHRLRVMSDIDSRDEDEKAWGYLKNALAIQNELTLRNNDLLSVQALLGMVSLRAFALRDPADVDDVGHVHARNPKSAAWLFPACCCSSSSS